MYPIARNVTNNDTMAAINQALNQVKTSMQIKASRRKYHEANQIATYRRFIS